MPVYYFNPTNEIRKSKECFFLETDTKYKIETTDINININQIITCGIKTYLKNYLNVSHFNNVRDRPEIENVLAKYFVLDIENQNIEKDISFKITTF